MALSKYRNVETDRNGRPLHWYRADQDMAPFRGAAVPLKEEEIALLGRIVFDVHCKLFDLDKEEHIQEYEEILDRIKNGWYQLIHRMFKEKPDGSWYVWLEWAEKYVEIPNVSQIIPSPSAPGPDESRESLRESLEKGEIVEFGGNLF